MKRVYFDHSATTPLAARVKMAMLAALESGTFGNPSSVHWEGRAARSAVENARDHVAALLGASRDRIVFTSGGTEGNAIAAATIRAAAERAGRPQIATLAIEHPSLKSALARATTAPLMMPIDAHGAIDVAALLETACLQDATGGLAFAWVNHELGTIQPIAELIALAHSRGVPIMLDAVQAVGKLATPIRVAELGVDLLTLSAHKLYGPKGVGAIYVASDTKTPLASLASGGHQERDRRPGTENFLGIVGLGEAARAAHDELSERVQKCATLGAQLRAGVVALGGVLNSPAAGLPSVVNVRFDGVEAPLLVESLDIAGFAISAGAACSSGSVAPSPVLLGLGQSTIDAKSAVRISIGADNDAAEIDAFLRALGPILMRIRAA